MVFNIDIKKKKTFLFMVVFFLIDINKKKFFLNIANKKTFFLYAGGRGLLLSQLLEFICEATVLSCLSLCRVFHRFKMRWQTVKCRFPFSLCLFMGLLAMWPSFGFSANMWSNKSLQWKGVRGGGKDGCHEVDVSEDKLDNSDFRQHLRITQLMDFTFEAKEANTFVTHQGKACGMHWDDWDVDGFFIKNTPIHNQYITCNMVKVLGVRRD